MLGIRKMAKLQKTANFCYHFKQLQFVEIMQKMTKLLEITVEKKTKSKLTF